MKKKLLSNIKIISTGSIWAGPHAARICAELGAQVFRINLPEQRVWTQKTPELIEVWVKKLRDEGMSDEEIKRAEVPSPFYTGNYQVNYYGVGLDLRNDKGKEIYKDLAKISNVVIDGWSPTVMSKFGLGYSDLKEINPSIIYVSIPALGMTGSEKESRMFGTAIEYVSGVTSTRGYLEQGPHRAGNYILDGISAPHILTAVLAALYYHAETGKGQHIDISQAECGTSVLGEAIMDYSMNKRIAKPIGNSHPTFAPYGCYRCKGDDMWVTIAITSEEEWKSFCKAIGEPKWTEESKFADMLSRWHNQDELNKLIEEWTVKHDHYAIQQILQNAGVAATAVVTIEEQVLHDPHVNDRNIYNWIPYHDGVKDPVFRAPFILSKTETSFEWCGPYTGQHNDYLLKDILGMSQEEVDRLVEENVVGVLPPPFTVFLGLT